MEQLTDAWFEARIGKVTASRVADVTAKTKTGWGYGRKHYMAELIAERLTGAKTQGYTNAAMQHGIDTEPMAREAYEAMKFCIVEPVGFVDHPRILMTGASPDGLVGHDGLIEIKCPNTATHIDTLLSQSVPPQYVKQMQWQMACTGRAWCDFASFDPRLPDNMAMFCRRVQRDDKLIAELEAAVAQFLVEVNDTTHKLMEIYGS